LFARLVRVSADLQVMSDGAEAGSSLDEVADAAFDHALALGQPEERAAAWHELWERFKDVPPPDSPAIALIARCNEANALTDMERFDDAVGICDELIAAHDPDGTLESQECTALALDLQRYVWVTLDRPAEIIAVADRAWVLFGSASDASLWKVVASSAFWQMWWLIDARRIDDALAVTDRLIERLGKELDQATTYETAEALRRCADGLFTHRRFARYHQKPVLRIAVRFAGGLDRFPVRVTARPRRTVAPRRACVDQCLRIYDLLIERFANAKKPQLSELAIRAQIERAVVLSAELFFVQGAREWERSQNLGAASVRVVTDLSEELNAQGDLRPSAAAYAFFAAVVAREHRQPGDERAAYTQLIDRFGRERSLRTRSIVLLARAFRLISNRPPLVKS
jgi:tetratricopeptide (TPR) repeat protein